MHRALAALGAAPATAVTVLVTLGTVFFPDLDIHHRTARQGITGELFDDIDIFGVAGRGQHIGMAAAARATGTADPMDIVVGMDWHV